MQKALKDFFGHNSFKPLQQEGVQALLDGRDLVMILPTGGGKSLVYQLPTMMRSGVSIVISPLIALMQDQVASLIAQNIPAAMLSSALSPQESSEVISSLLSGELKFLYLSPERLANSATVELLHQVELNFFIVDEAHCISQWGHEFRDDFRLLHQLRYHFSKTPIAAIIPQFVKTTFYKV